MRQGRGSGFRKRRMGQREWKAQVEAWRVGQSYWVNSWRDLIQIFGTRNERTFRCSTSILVLRRKEGFPYLQHSYIFTRGKNSPISPKTIYTHYCIITFDLLCSLQIFRICLFIRDAIRASSTSKRHKCGRTRRGREREIILLFHRGDKISNRYLAWSSRDYRYNLCASLESPPNWLH